MTINGIGPNPAYLSTQGIALDGEGELALLLLESEEAQRDANHQTKLLARDRFIDASNEQVAAMHDEADAIALGAYFQAGVSLTASAIRVGDVVDEPKCDPVTKQTPVEKPWGELGAGVADALSAPLGKAIGDAPAAEARADAKVAATSAQLAEWQLGDAAQAIRESGEQQDEITDWLEAQWSSQHATEQAIIAGLA